MKPIFEYCLSAPTFGVYPNVNLENLPCHHVKEVINNYATILHKTIQKNARNFKPEASLMYNAFTEKEKIKFFKYYGHCGFKNIYSDSGGLQIVTRNFPMTPELKDEIYDFQTYSDLALCFDVIKVSRTTISHHRNERSQDSNKIFHQGEHKEAGYLTGQNIKRQIQRFRELGAKTKVLIIVQGNNRNDMLTFFREIEKQLTDEDYEHIGGFAMANTCIGKGQIEMVEILCAAREISHNCHDNVKQHMHLLGVGSVPRLAPAIFLKKSNFLDKLDRISYDSSKLTQALVVGSAIHDTRILRLGTRQNEMSTEYFTNQYNMYAEYLQTKNFTLDDYLNMIFGDRSETWSDTKMVRWARKTGDEWKIGLSHCCRAAHTFQQLVNFNENIDGLFDGQFRLKPEHVYLNTLAIVQDEKDMTEWFRHQKQTKKTRSKRVRREEEVKSIEGLFI